MSAWGQSQREAADTIRDTGGGARVGRMRVRNVLVRRAHADDLPRLLELLRLCVGEMQRGGIDQWDDVYPSEATVGSDVAAGSLYVAAAPGHPIAGAFVFDQRQEPV